MIKTRTHSLYDIEQAFKHIELTRASAARKGIRMQHKLFVGKHGVFCVQYEFVVEPYGTT